MLIHRATGKVELLKSIDGKSSPALGLFAGSVYPTAQCPLSPNDLIMLFTDGLYDVDGPNEELFNPEWLLAEVSRARLPRRRKPRPSEPRKQWHTPQVFPSMRGTRAQERRQLKKQQMKSS